MYESDGKKSNKNGSNLENLVTNSLLSAGFVEISNKDKKTFIRTRDFNWLSNIYGLKWFVQQISLDKNLYGAKYKMDFFLYHKKVYPSGLNIECKWQGSPGSIDEKYVFTVMSLKKIN